MSMQLNLLPDIKLEYVKARRTQRLVISGAILLSAISLVIFILLLLFVRVAQEKSLRDVNKDIKTSTATLKAIPDLNKILTVQNQLNSLPSINQQKPAVSRLAGDILKLTPKNAYINRLNVDYTQKIATLTGTADTIDTVNTFADTLKFTTYNSSTIKTPTKAFSNVVLSAFGRDSKQASYTITLSFDPEIFNITDNTINLTVPNQVTTRSTLEQPTDLFQASTNTGSKQ